MYKINPYTTKLDNVGNNNTNPTIISYGSFYDTTTQTVASNTPKAMEYNTTDLSVGISIINDISGKPTIITPTYNGVYNVQFSAQLERPSGGGGNSAQVLIWLRINGLDIPYTTTHVTVQSNQRYVVAAWNFFVSLIAGEKLQIIWAQDDAIQILYEAAWTTPAHPYARPEVPSVILTVTKIN